MPEPAGPVVATDVGAGIRLRNPVIAASGTFGYGVEFAGVTDLRALGAKAIDLWMYVVVTVPSYLALVLLLALLVSLMFVLGKLHRANEFTALRAAGVSMLRITAPVW